jgi:hypothetical protein
MVLVEVGKFRSPNNPPIPIIANTIKRRKMTFIVILDFITVHSFV